LRYDFVTDAFYDIVLDVSREKKEKNEKIADYVHCRATRLTLNFYLLLFTYYFFPLTRYLFRCIIDTLLADTVFLFEILKKKA